MQTGTADWNCRLEPQTGTDTCRLELIDINKIKIGMKQDQNR